MAPYSMHVSIQCVDMVASAAFYDAVLAPLGVTRIMDTGTTIGYGTPPRPDFSIGAQATGDASASRTCPSPRPTGHRCSRDSSRRRPGVAPRCCTNPRVAEYHDGYYAAFVRDPEGNNIEAVCRLPV